MFVNVIFSDILTDTNTIKGIAGGPLAMHIGGHFGCNVILLVEPLENLQLNRKRSGWIQSYCSYALVYDLSCTYCWFYMPTHSRLCRNTTALPVALAQPLH